MCRDFAYSVSSACRKCFSKTAAFVSSACLSVPCRFTFTWLLDTCKGMIKVYSNDGGLPSSTLRSLT